MKAHGLARGCEASYVQDTHSKSSISGKSRKGLPSLDNISKRLAGNISISRAEPMGTIQGRPSPSGNRLPAFLKRASTDTNNVDVVPTQKQQLTPTAKDQVLYDREYKALGGWQLKNCEGGRSTAAYKRAWAYLTSSRHQYTQHQQQHGYIRIRNHRAAEQRTRSRIPLSSLQALTSNSMAGNYIVGQQTPALLTAEVLQQRTERDCMTIERLSRRVSAPREMNTQQSG